MQQHILSSIALALSIVLSVPLVTSGQTNRVSRPIEGNIWAGVGAMGGDVTYQIGGHYSTPSESGAYPFPLSELKWPVNVGLLTLGGDLRFHRKWELRGQFSKNLTQESGQMEDSDWTDDWNPSLKTIYSESDADLTAVTVECALRYWLMEQTLKQNLLLSLAAGAGLLYQDFRWEASNLDQWYPPNPEYGHDRVSGLVGTYQDTLTMPFLEAAGEFRYHQRLSFLMSLGIAPYAMVSDEDDHKLRYILTKSDTTGYAVKTSLQARCDFTRHWFGKIQLEGLSFNTDGTEHNEVYGGTDQGTTWSIEHKIMSTQLSVILATGMSF